MDDDDDDEDEDVVAAAVVVGVALVKPLADNAAGAAADVAA